MYKVCKQILQKLFLYTMAYVEMKQNQSRMFKKKTPLTDEF